MAEGCIFCRIGAGQIPVEPVYEDQEFIAFPDAHPQAPVHVLVIPRAHFETFMAVDDEALLGRAMGVIQEVARRTNIADPGFRAVVNCGGDGGQTVYHLHWHVMGGRFMQWPPG